MRTDERAEFEVFVRDASPRLLSTAWYLTGSADRAEEVTQHALTKVFAHWSRVRRDDAYAYTRTTLVNLVRDEARRRLREFPSATMPVEPATPARDAEHVDIVRALESLSSRQREVVVLRHLADLSERQVADTLGISVGTVKSTAADGLRKLRAALTGGEHHVL